MRNVLILIFSFVFAFQASSQEWIYFSESGNHNKVYYRSNFAVEKIGNIDSAIKVWTKEDHRKITLANKEFYDVQVLTMYYIDCAKRRYSISSSIAYGKDGSTITSYDDGIVAPSRAIIPETLIEALAEKICK